MDPSGKVALVTGGVQGLGLGIVKELLQQGVKGVSICDVNVARAASVVKQLEEEFGKNRVIFIKTDVTKADDFEGAFEETVKKFGDLNIVINNAGICNDKNWQTAVAINVGGVIQGVLLALKYMSKQHGGKGGVVVNTGSVAGLRGGTKVLPVYNATKHAVLGFTLSFESPFLYQQTGVRMMVMSPGYTKSEIIGTDESQIKPLTFYDEWMPEFHRELQLHTPAQSCENVAEGVLRMIREGKNGSVWLCRNDIPAHEIDVPVHEKLLDLAALPSK